MSGVRVAVEDGRKLSGVLHYVEQEYSFWFEPVDEGDVATRGADGRSSLLVADLQIEIGLPSQALLFVWGLHPHLRWQETSLAVPNFREGLVRVTDPVDVSPGASEELADRFEWVSEWDRETGWLRVVSPRGEGSIGVEICDGVALTVQDDQIRSVWLKPSTT